MTEKKIMLYTGSQFVLVIYVLKMLMITKEAPFFFLEYEWSVKKQLELEIELMLDIRSLFQRLHFT